MLQSMELQRAEHDLAGEQQQQQTTRDFPGGPMANTLCSQRR